jgi:hypothetical protein
MASIAQAYGTGWEVPGRGFFGVDAFAFGTPEAAQAFLAETELRANSCMAAPTTYARPESEAQWFIEPQPPDTVWSVTDVSAAFPEPTAGAEFLLRAVRTRSYTLTRDGTGFAANESSLGRYERHGRVVLEFWLDGSWGFSGFDNNSELVSSQPTDADLDGLAAIFQPIIVQRLTTAGVL